ncbi:MAG: hypothetical protein ACUVR0_10640 [Candidatus Aminicenantales bacterium]
MKVRREIKPCPKPFQERATSSLLPGTPLLDGRQSKVCWYGNDVKGVARLDYLYFI